MYNIFKKTRKLLFICILIIITPLIFARINLNTLENEVLLYLQEDKKYTLDDIESISKDFGHIPRFSIWISFKDEIYMSYQYTKKRNQIIQQTYDINEDGESQGIKFRDVNPKHYDPPKPIQRRY